MEIFSSAALIPSSSAGVSVTSAAPMFSSRRFSVAKIGFFESSVFSDAAGQETFDSVLDSFICFSIVIEIYRI
jgi:hypothetical protein